MLPDQWRTISPEDKCCSISENLKPSINFDGSVIDGVWICSVCGLDWYGKGKGEYLDHKLRTLTEFGKNFIESMDDVMKEGKHLSLPNVIGKMEYKVYRYPSALCIYNEN